MANVWVYSLISVVFVSLISLVGVLTIFLTKDFLRKLILLMVSFSAGALLGDVFFHLLPELVESAGLTVLISFYILSGILLFFTLEKFIIWHHCHNIQNGEECHPFVYTNLIGDALHNFIDGMIIADSFLISLPLGIATTMAVIFHEIPQEIGDFGVLLHAGFGKARALMYNFLSAVAAILGAITVLIIGSQSEDFSLFVVALSAGGFIYIACSDLIPELHKESVTKKSFLQFSFFVCGLVVMALLLFIE
ncbi:ZIP family metal transporter [Candidatus Wolfebacteria bacterium]|nr:ZIP family metal transporter [Candidatus Wolfebacteria bacterium]